MPASISAWATRIAAQGWHKRREAKEPALVALDITWPLDHLADAGVELLLLDAPPGQPPYLAKLLINADVVLVPVRPTPDDLLAAAPIASSLARHRP